MRIRQARNDSPLKALGKKHDLSGLDSNQQIRNGDLTFQRRAGTSEIYHFEVSEDRTAENIANPSFRQVDNLGKDGVRIMCLLLLDIISNESIQFLISVAKAT